MSQILSTHLYRISKLYRLRRIPNNRASDKKLIIRTVIELVI